MEYTGNYLIQARQAREHFCSYDRELLAEKFSLPMDRDYLYVTVLGELWRIGRRGELEYREGQAWQDGNRFEAVMTIFDILCDSRENRHLSGRWKNMQSFGLMFHQNLLEEQKDPRAERFDRDPEGLRRVLLSLGGENIPGADIGYSVELMAGLRVGLQFWQGDDEFPPRLRYLWDENALQYLRYETMYYAVDLLLNRIEELM